VFFPDLKKGDQAPMTLQAKLDEYKRSFIASGRATPEMRAVMVRSTGELRASGLLDRALKAGDKVPSFQLPNQDGQPVSSTALFAKGPLILSFFRGVW
jgi:AhpC/TSA family